MSITMNVGSKNKSGSKIIAPRPLKTPTVSPIIEQHFPKIEDLEAAVAFDSDEDCYGSDIDSGENELQQIFGGALNCTNVYHDEDFPLYDSDDLPSVNFERPQISIAFPVLGASPAPSLERLIPSRSKNPMAMNNSFYEYSDKKRSPVAQHITGQLIFSFTQSPHQARHRSYSEPVLPIAEIGRTEVGSYG